MIKNVVIISFYLILILKLVNSQRISEDEIDFYFGGGFAETFVVSMSAIFILCCMITFVFITAYCLGACTKRVDRYQNHNNTPAVATVLHKTDFITTQTDTEVRRPIRQMKVLTPVNNRPITVNDGHFQQYY